MPYIPEYMYRVLTADGSVLEKTRTSPNLTNRQPDIDKIVYTLNIHLKKTHQYLINKRDDVALKQYSDQNAIFNTFVIKIISTAMLRSTIQERDTKYWLILRYWLLIWSVIKNYTQAIKLFIRSKKRKISVVFISLFIHTTS